MNKNDEKNQSINFINQGSPQQNPLQVNLNTTDTNVIDKYSESKKKESDRDLRLNMMKEKLQHKDHDHHKKSQAITELEATRAKILDIIELDRLSPDQKLTKQEFEYLRDQEKRVKKEIDEAKLQEAILENDKILEKNQEEIDKKYDLKVSEAIKNLSIEKFNNTSEKKIINPLKKLEKDLNEVIFSSGKIVSTGDTVAFFRSEIEKIKKEMESDDVKKVLMKKNNINDKISSIETKLTILAKKSTNPFMSNLHDDTQDALERTIFIPKNAFDQVAHDFVVFLEKLFGLNYKANEIIQTIGNQISEISSIFSSLDSTKEDNVKIERMFEIHTALSENIRKLKTEINIYIFKDKKYQNFLNKIEEYATQIKNEIYDIENPKYAIYNMFTVEGQPFLKQDNKIERQRLGSIGGILYSIIINNNQYSKNGSDVFYPDKIFQEIYKISEKNNHEISIDSIKNVCSEEIKKLSNEIKSDKTKEDGNIKKISILQKMIDQSAVFLNICDGKYLNVPDNFKNLYLPKDEKEYDQIYNELYKAQDEKIKQINEGEFLKYETKVDSLIDELEDKYIAKIDKINLAIKKLKLLKSEDEENKKNNIIIEEKIKEYQLAIEKIEKEKDKKIEDTKKYFYISQEQKNKIEKEINENKAKDSTGRIDSAFNKVYVQLFSKIISKLNGIKGEEKEIEKKKSRSTNPSSPLDLSELTKQENRYKHETQNLHQEELNTKPDNYKDFLVNNTKSTTKETQDIKEEQDDSRFNIKNLSSLQTGFNNQTEMNQSNTNKIDISENHQQDIH